MTVRLQAGQVWEDETGAQLRLVDDDLSDETELYYAPVSVVVEPVTENVSGFISEERSSTRILRDTLVQQCTLVGDDPTPAEE